MGSLLVRPLWREFEPEALRAAAKHARAGGLSVVKAERSWQLFGDAGPEGEELPLFVDWAIRAIEAPRWWEVTEGAARGLVTARISRGWRERVGEWIARDKAFVGASAKASFDCMKCGACCYDNEVLLDAADLLRFKKGGRADVAKRVRRDAKNRPLLPLDRKTKACIHLDRLKCSIYEVRPFMCRDFEAGTEQCMTSREDLYGSPFPEGR